MGNILVMEIRGSDEDLKKFFKKKKKFLKNMQKMFDKYFGVCYYIRALSKLTGCSAVGSARGLGPWGREFESLHPDHQKTFFVLTYFRAFSSVG